jgi:hypothetical protein
MNQKSKFRKMMERTACIVTVLAFGFILAAYFTDGGDPWFTFAMIFGTTAYHFVMRLAVGGSVAALFPKEVNCENFWFRERKFERKLYAFLRVKKWKGKKPTYNPDDFSLKKHTYSEVIRSMCVAEVGHEIIIVLSFVPLLFSFFGNQFWLNFSIMAATSLIAAAVESQFVIMQRFNRPRMIRLQKRETQ